MGQSDVEKASMAGSSTPLHSVHMSSPAKQIPFPSRAERIAFLRDTVIAVALSLAVILIGCNYVIYKMPPLPTVADRIVFTLRFLCLSMLPLVGGIIYVGNLRFIFIQTPKSDVSAMLEETLDRHTYCLQDTFLQTFVHCVIMLSLSTFLEESAMKLTPILTILFILGRVAFWVGYVHRPLARAFGFALTFFPTLLSLCYCVIRLFWKGTGWDLPIPL